MLDALGSFSAIWLGLWFGLSIFFVTLYPLVRRRLFSLHPRYGSLLLLGYWSGPFLLSLLSTTLLYLPVVETWFVDAHCHSDCVSHVPVLQSRLLSLTGLALAAGILTLCLYRLFTNVHASMGLRRQFNLLGVSESGYHRIDCPEPVVFTLGWWRPQVYLSRGVLERCAGREVDIVLDHEQEHRRRRDNLRLLLARVFGLLLPSRLSRRLMNDLRLLTEQACDFRAAESWGEVPVAEALLKMQKVLQRRHGLPDVAMAFAEREVEQRIVAVLQSADRHQPSSGQLSLLWLGLMLYFVFIIEPLHHGSEWLIGLL